MGFKPHRYWQNRAIGTESVCVFKILWRLISDQ